MLDIRYYTRTANNISYFSIDNIFSWLKILLSAISLLNQLPFFFKPLTSCELKYPITHSEANVCWTLRDVSNPSAPWIVWVPCIFVNPRKNFEMSNIFSLHWGHSAHSSLTSYSSNNFCNGTIFRKFCQPLLFVATWTCASLNPSSLKSWRRTLYTNHFRDVPTLNQLFQIISGYNLWSLTTEVCFGYFHCNGAEQLFLYSWTHLTTDTLEWL